MRLPANGIRPLVTYFRSGGGLLSGPQIGKRYIKIRGSRTVPFDLDQSTASTETIPDARFEVIGHSNALLHVTLSASQNIFTRRGTLIGLAGKAENVRSTLSILKPLTRSLLRIPFLYQRISSTTQVSSLFSTKGLDTFIEVIQLDGTTDWTVTGKALLAWTGQTLLIRPKAIYKNKFAYWGNTEIFGRGLVAVTGRGSIMKIVLQHGESYLVHPSSLVAYSMGQTPPILCRIQLSLQMSPSSTMLPDLRVFRSLRASTLWRFIVGMWRGVRSWMNEAIWGDGAFLRFHGPSTLLIQTRPLSRSEHHSTQSTQELAH